MCLCAHSPLFVNPMIETRMSVMIFFSSSSVNLKTDPSPLKRRPTGGEGGGGEGGGRGGGEGGGAGGGEGGGGEGGGAGGGEGSGDLFGRVIVEASGVGD